MRRLLSERNFVVLLFVVALAVFVMAQQDAKKIEKKYMNPDSAVSIAPSSEKPAVGKIVNEPTPVIISR
jgi:hypothetical protein